MKLSDYVVKFIKNTTGSVFLLSGGGIMHLVDSLRKSNLNVYCCHHEQGAAIAAEGYSRIKNRPGIAVVTSGPGVTNTVTGIAGAWLDSIPIIIIAGQVKRKDITARKNGKQMIRQTGFQELNVVDIVKPITKYAVTVKKEKEIRFHLEKAIYLATHGRPGPVFVEIPLDVQAVEIDLKKLKSFIPPKKDSFKKNLPIKEVVKELKNAKRPLLLVGNGVRLAGAEKNLLKFLEKYKINTVTSIFTADDLVTCEYEKYLGRQGMPGNESANFAADNCDLLLVIGERLQLTQTSFDYENFAKQAIKIMVDIDKEEMHKKTIKIDIPIQCDAKEFLTQICREDFKLNDWNVKVNKIDCRKYAPGGSYLNVYKFIEKLGECSRGMTVATANGMASLVSHQALKIRRGQRFITNAGLGHMGSGLPLSIGASIAGGMSPVICCEGDGSIMLNIQELQTIIYHKLPIKIFIFNNGGYYSIRNTHQRFFGKIFAADCSCGVSLPDFSVLIPAWGLKYERISTNKELKKLPAVINYAGPIVCELIIAPDQPMLPKWTAGQLKK